MIKKIIHNYIPMKRFAYITCTTLLIAGGLFVTQYAQAVGGGGGGSVPSCSEDVWQCGSFGACTSDNGKKEFHQHRECTKTFECDNVTTPSPNTVEKCTPPAPIEPEPVVINEKPQPLPSVVDTEKKTSAPVEETASCTQDIWKCDVWNSCDKNGDQTRTCTKITDCPGVDTDEPPFTKRCEHLQCGEIESMRERVLCRLKLTPAGLEREYTHEYLPEECRGEVKDKQQKCIDRYKSYKPCWKVPVGQGRIACARTALQLSGDIPQAKRTCANDETCMKDLRWRVHALIKFRMYDLEERAEALQEKGADVEAIADFVTLIGENKQAYNTATTKEERKNIILNVREGWKTFVLRVKDQIN